MQSKLSQLFALARDIIKLPVASLEFTLASNPEDVRFIYAHFTKRHPKYKLFQNKSLGAALVDLERYASRDEYLKSVKGRNSAEHHARKARGRGYKVVEIDRNEFIDDLYRINTSVEMRQGRPMEEAYHHKVLQYEQLRNYKYFGTLNSAGELMAYANLGFYGNFAAFERLLGVRNNDGAMHLMITEIICQLIESRRCRYIMYDTYFGASPGLKAFKNMFGFEPYRAKYSIHRCEIFLTRCVWINLKCQSSLFTDMTSTQIYERQENYLRSKKYTALNRLIIFDYRHSISN